MNRLCESLPTIESPSKSPEGDAAELPRVQGKFIELFDNSEGVGQNPRFSDPAVFDTIDTELRSLEGAASRRNLLILKTE